MRRGGRRAAFVRPVFVLPAMLAGCGGGEEEAYTRANSSVIQVERTDEQCALSIADIPAGRVIMRVRNGGTESADFAIVRSGGTKALEDVTALAAGDETELQFKIKAGRYDAVCSAGSAEPVRTELLVLPGA
jgi:hypothetical protein